jgi:hypothetical protein
MLIIKIINDVGNEHWNNLGLASMQVLYVTICQRLWLAAEREESLHIDRCFERSYEIQLWIVECKTSIALIWVIHCIQLTPCSQVLLEKPTVAQPLKKFPELFVIQ